jgi:enoyl-CoA hydratase/carnithine racemase
MTNPPIVVDRPAEAVVRLAFNRPEKRNPLETETREMLLSSLGEALDDPTVRAIILTGNGGTFCAGGDIAAMGKSDERSGADRMARNHVLTRRIGRAEKPVIAAVEGFAFGAGAGIALLCDAIVAGQGASIGFSFFRMGLVPDYGIVHTLTQRIGFGKARLLLLRAATLKAPEALQLGLFDQVVPDADVQSAALALAVELAAQPANAVALTKRMLLAEPQGFDAALDLERTSQVMSFLTADHREGVAAFRDKRAPKFS